MEKWVSLQTTESHSISINETTIAAGGADGVVRLFRKSDLNYEGSLPLPPTIPHINSTTKSPPATTTTTTSPSPAAICVRFLPASKLAVIYSDNSLFVWDVSNKNNIGKYRSFLHHAGPIWDIQFLPTKTKPQQQQQKQQQQQQLQLQPSPTHKEESTDPQLPESTFVTCSSDQTVRFWNLNTPGKAKIVHPKWKKLFSKDLVHVAARPGRHGSEQVNQLSPLSASSSSSRNDNTKISEEIKKNEIPESELSQRIEPVDALRSLSAHSLRTEIACGGERAASAQKQNRTQTTNPVILCPPQIEPATC